MSETLPCGCVPRQHVRLDCWCSYVTDLYSTNDKPLRMPAEGCPEHTKRLLPCGGAELDHDHAFPLPAGYADPDGRPVDMDLLGALVGAAFDGCTTCQDAELSRVVQNAPTTARLVELACVTVQASLGGLPSSLTDRNVPGLTTTQFRTLARAGMNDNNTRMFEKCESMTVPGRRAAANDALELIIGHMVTGL